mmetsp:Transcript_16480/g.62669  ORF Transcript_16480/g.62669 Transcript_16480/m.62669 type:complete len:265 (+) Transcript_16480:301-1095(+)
MAQDVDAAAPVLREGLPLLHGLPLDRDVREASAAGSRADHCGEPCVCLGAFLDRLRLWRNACESHREHQDPLLRRHCQGLSVHLRRPHGPRLEEGCVARDPTEGHRRRMESDHALPGRHVQQWQSRDHLQGRSFLPPRPGPAGGGELSFLAGSLPSGVGRRGSRSAGMLLSHVLPNPQPHAGHVAPTGGAGAGRDAPSASAAVCVAGAGHDCLVSSCSRDGAQLRGCAAYAGSGEAERRSCGGLRDQCRSRGAAAPATLYQHRV